VAMQYVKVLQVFLEHLTEDEVWVIVKRTINGATKRFVECFSDFDFDETTATDFKFLDSHLSYSGSATTTLSGLITFRRSISFNTCRWCSSCK
jgi:hypothetical protein